MERGLRRLLASKNRKDVETAIRNGTLIPMLSADLKKMGIKNINSIKVDDMKKILDDNSSLESYIEYIDNMVYEPYFKNNTNTMEKSLVDNVFQVFDFKQMAKLELRLNPYRAGFLFACIIFAAKSLNVLQNKMIIHVLVYGILCRDSFIASTNCYFKGYVVKYARKIYPDSMSAMVSNTVVRAFQTAFGMRNENDDFPKKLKGPINYSILFDGTIIKIFYEYCDNQGYFTSNNKKKRE